jgi:hypothetical protein
LLVDAIGQIYECKFWGVTMRMKNEQEAESTHEHKDLSFIEESNIYGLAVLLVNNIGHALPLSFYSMLGAATKMDLPVVGRVHPSIPVSFFAANVYARIDETSKLLEDPFDKSHHRHEIYADAIVNGGLAAISATAVASLGSATALPVIGAFFVGDIVSHADGSPVDYLKAGLASTLDNVFGDWL